MPVGIFCAGRRNGGTLKRMPDLRYRNVKAVDILAPERQRELGKVVAALAKFAPARVAVEWPEQIVNELNTRESIERNHCLREQPSVQLVDPLSYLADI